MIDFQSVSSGYIIRKIEKLTYKGIILVALVIVICANIQLTNATSLTCNQFSAIENEDFW